MRINNVDEIHDNGEFVTIVTSTGTAIHLPAKCEHSISIVDRSSPADNPSIDVIVDLYQS